VLAVGLVELVRVDEVTDRPEGLRNVCSLLGHETTKIA
jgi:hypothetical protein